MTPRLTEDQRIEALLVRQIQWLKDIDARLCETNQLLKQLVDAEAPQTFPGTTGAEVRIS